MMSNRSTYCSHVFIVGSDTWHNAKGSFTLTLSLSFSGIQQAGWLRSLVAEGRDVNQCWKSLTTTALMRPQNMMLYHDHHLTTRHSSFVSVCLWVLAHFHHNYFVLLLVIWYFRLKVINNVTGRVTYILPYIPESVQSNKLSPSLSECRKQSLFMLMLIQSSI